MPMHCNISNTR